MVQYNKFKGAYKIQYSLIKLGLGCILICNERLKLVRHFVDISISFINIVIQ
jgi:hypothetical protein